MDRIAAEWLSKYDTNENGRLDDHEVYYFFKAVYGEETGFMGALAANRRTGDIMKEYDLDEDRALSLEEWRAVWLSHQAQGLRDPTELVNKV